jgi:gluconokinase
MLIAIDIGTTNVKALAMTASGIPCAWASRQNETLCPQPGWSEQDPEALFQQVLAVLREVLSHENMVKTASPIQGIVFSAAMHGFMAVDAAGQPLTNIWLWSDLRADQVARDLLQEQGLAMYNRTGVPIHAMSPLCKLHWLRNKQPNVFKKAYKFLGIKEFIWFRLTGKLESDLSCASASGFLNIWHNAWDLEVLAMAGIEEAHLPVVVSPSHTAQLLESISLPCSQDFPLIIGASDGALANLGSGATKPDQLAVTIGTSAAIRCISNQAVVDAHMRTFCYRLDETRCIVGGASNNGTNVLEWLRKDVFRSLESPEVFVNQALGVSPGADGLLFLPYIQGERAPLWDAQVRGSFHGLVIGHGQAHFVRAALEGILFNLKIISESMFPEKAPEALHVGGGFVNNALWVQMLADIFQSPVHLPENGMDVSLYGAIQLGRSALGLAPLVSAQEGKIMMPNTANAQIYKEVFERFLEKLPLRGGVVDE